MAVERESGRVSSVAGLAELHVEGGRTRGWAVSNENLVDLKRMCLAQDPVNDLGTDLIQMEDLVGQARTCDKARHSPDDAAGLILNDDL
jgi:hypothetical protein